LDVNHRLSARRNMSFSDLIDWLGMSELRTHPQIKLSTLPLDYFKFPPASLPATVPPPAHHSALSHPFTIPTETYNTLLEPVVPVTVALVYMSVVYLLNQVNANRDHRPWAISRTRVFKLMVILHNIFLAAYSAWTFVGMINAVYLSMPALDENWKISKATDALCKMHGPRGAGNAAYYNSTTSAWTMTNRLFHLAADGLGPESTDVGRIWNEGLAFYGWLFYLSKFYEVVDTFIILAKGRKSSFLQTYHHAGAMLCMWAGIRYMSPPIWMFVLVNSFIHAVMYTFYMISAMGMRVPKGLKRTLTSLQITQFVVGATYAFLHLFVAYQIPVSVPYLYHLGGVASKVATEAPTQITSTIVTAVSTAAPLTAWLKKAALRAAGYEGLAENVLNDQGKPFGVDAVHIIEDTVRREETRYRDELLWTHCLDTSGQVFAILLNVVYLLPLTWLFVQFFITAYSQQLKRRRSSTASDAAIAAQKSFFDASKGVGRQLSEAIEEMHNVSEDIGEDAILVDGDEIKREMKEEAQKVVDALKKGQQTVAEKVQNSGLSPEAVKQEVQKDMEAARKALSDGADKVKNAASNITDEQTRQNIADRAQAVKDSAKEAVDVVIENVKAAAGYTKEQAKPAVDAIAEKDEQAKEQAGPTIDAAKQKAAELKDQAGPTAEVAAQKAADLKDRAVETVQSAAGQAKDTASNAETRTKSPAKKAAKKLKKTGEQAGDKADDAADRASEETKATANSAKSKAEGASNKADNVKKDESSSKDESDEKSSPLDSKQSPNGRNGTNGDEAAESTQNQEEKEKKTEDKIIDDSQTVRDKDVDTKGKGKDGAGN
jgi:hypothetical protein